MIVFKNRAQLSNRTKLAARYILRQAQDERIRVSQKSSHSARTELVEVGERGHRFLQPAFSLLEAIVAILIIGLMVGSLFKLQGQLFQGTYSAQFVLERMAIIRNVFAKASEEEWFKTSASKEYKDEGPPTKLFYKFEKVSSNSELKNIKNLYTERVDAEWPELRGIHKDTFVSFRLHVDTEKKEK